MASLKEVKARIASVNNTLKITSAMKMVASAKLHHAQSAIENMLPYQQKLNSILEGFLSAEGGSGSSPYAEKHDLEHVAIVAVSSDSSLCGAFNANVVRKLHETIHSYASLRHDQITIYPIGKKITDAVRKAGFEPQGDFRTMAEKPTYKEASRLAGELMERYATHQVDRVELIYNHFKSTATQLIMRDTYLPIHIEPTEHHTMSTDYIVEPDQESVIQTLIPQVLALKIFTMMLDSNAAEHAARTIAMQMATDNATDLIQDLTIQYNKTRQQMITSELLDMMGAEIANQ